jgi:integrase
VQESKTDAGQGRTIDLPLGLADELRAHRAAAGDPAPDDPVFRSRGRNGNRSRQSPDNVGRRLKTAIRDANERLEQRGIEPISERVSPHSLRRTYASLRAALHDDPTYIADQLGHEDPTFAISVYAKAVKRRERLSDEYREAFDQALQWATIGAIAAPQLAVNGRKANASGMEAPILESDREAEAAP